MRLIGFRQILANARLYIADDFLDAGEIDQLLAVGARAEQESDCIATAKHDETGFSFEMPREGNSVLGAIFARMEAAFGFADKCGGSMRFRRYYPGEYHPLHYDNFEISGNFLVATAMMWLTDTPGGGETRFPYTTPAPLLLSPRAGRVAVWLNYLPDGTIDRAAMHEALPVAQGNKVTLTNFIYNAIDVMPAFGRGLRPEAAIPGIQFERLLSEA